MNNSERSFSILLMLAVLLPFLSWALSALGVPCRSILDGEGLRWLFRHVSDCLHGQFVMFALCCLMMQGVIKKSEILPLGRTIRDTKFLLYFAVYSVVFISIILAATTTDSPLLSITGGLAGSPLLDGLLFLVGFRLLCSVFAMDTTKVNLGLRCLLMASVHIHLQYLLLSCFPFAGNAFCI